MIIKKIHIAGYGHFCDFISPQFSENVNVIYGSNEAGKSTLMSFIACTVYGLHAEKHPPVQGGIHGGRIFLLEDDQRQYTIERFATPRRKTGEFSCIDEDGTNANQFWEKRFATIDKELFESIFWLTHNELEQLPLEKGRLADYLYSASMGVHGVNYIETMKKLGTKREELFKKRGKSQPINQQIAKIEQLDLKYKEVRSELDGYQEMNKQKIELEEEIVMLEQKSKELQQQQLYVKKLEKAWIYWENYNQAQEQIKAIFTEKQQKIWFDKTSMIEALYSAMPAHRQVLINMKELQIESQQRESRLHIEVRKVGLDWDESRIEEFRMGLAVKEQIRSTKTRLAKLEQDELYLKRAMDEAVEKEKEQRQYDDDAINLANKRIGSYFIQPALMTTIVVAIFMLTFTLNDFIESTSLEKMIAVGVVAFIASIWGYAYYQHSSQEKESVKDVIRNQEYVKRQGDLAKRHWQDAAKVYEQEMLVWKEWLEENGFSATSNPDEIMAIIMAIENLHYQIEAKNEVANKLHQCKQEVHRYRNQVKRVLVDLLKMEQVPSEIEEHFVYVYDSMSKQIQLRNQALQSIKLLAPPEQTSDELIAGLQESNILHIQNQIEQDKIRINDYHTALREKREVMGTYRLRLEQLATDDRLVELNLQRNEERDVLSTKVKEWTIATMANWVLKKSKSSFEAEHQPEVMKLATDLFVTFTERRYQRIAIPVAETSMKVLHANGNWLQIDQLSQGTKEQLYLSLRLGFLDQFRKRHASWPIFMDDVLVNFDRKRMEKAIETIIQIGNSQQVFFFTCHEHIAEAFAKVSSTNLASFQLERQELRAVFKDHKPETRR